MEDLLNKMEYEAPALDELYLCPAVQAGPSQTPELNEDPDESASHENEGGSNW